MHVSFLFTPILLAIGEFVLLAATGGFFGYSLTKLLNRLKEGSFCILGERGSGKTTLHHFLSYGEILTGKYKQTTSKKTKKNTLKLEDFKFKIKENIDIGGSEIFKNEWKGIIKDSDYVCYIIRGDKIYSNDKIYIKEILEHVNLIFDFKTKEKKLYLIVSHLDKIKEYNTEPDIIIKKIGNVLKTTVLKKGTKVFYGNLKNLSGTREIVTSLINDIMKSKKNN